MTLERAPFESVAEAERHAERRVPRDVFKAVQAGAERGVTLRDNVDAFAELELAPRVADLVDERSLDTTVMGTHVSLPVITSPAGVQALHPDGELAVARATAAAGTAIGLSLFASKPLEAVVRANARTFMQLYWSGGRREMGERVQRAMSAGAVGLIATLDWSFSKVRDWGSPSIPERLSFAAALQFAPQALGRPRWLVTWLKAGLPDLRVPNWRPLGSPAPTFSEAYEEWRATKPPTWDDLRWLREQWPGRLMLKGIMRVDDAKRAAETGVSAISVSNHGGNNLDGTPASIRALPAIADAVGDQVEVLLDGGIRRGSDVVKARALGARAVMIGRPYLWGLAAAGQPGVGTVIEIIRNGADSTLLALGHRAIADVSRRDVVVPPGFTRELGSPGT